MWIQTDGNKMPPFHQTTNAVLMFLVEPYLKLVENNTPYTFTPSGSIPVC
jgi:hypothetical protein